MEATALKIRSCRWAGLLTGGVLLAAAILKLSSSVGPSLHHWKLVALPCLEISLALWLLSGIRPRLALSAGSVVFCSFAVITLWKIVHGASDCGCFGAWSPSPKVTFWIDVAALIASLTALKPPRRGVLIAWMLVLWAALYAGALFLAKELSSPPSFMVGDRWPAPGAVDVPADLSKGRWVVLIYDSECHRCVSVAENYAGAVSAWGSWEKGTRLALLDVSQSGDSDQQPPPSGHTRIVRGTLLQRDLYEHSPIRILLDEGRILDVRREWEASNPVP